MHTNEQLLAPYTLSTSPDGRLIFIPRPVRKTWRDHALFAFAAIGAAAGLYTVALAFIVVFH